ncbi:MerR family transcriptional regulator, partial [Patescibacteria group bacterium]|nr:MerR family transcriptional regulator [Patescibacteria group bacterium]
MESQRLLPISEIISLAQTEGIDLGRGDPYHRLRYFIKLGLLPNAKRQTNPTNGKVEGHFPQSVLETLRTINELDHQGLNRAQIKKTLAQQAGAEAQKTQQKPPTKPEVRVRRVAAAVLSVILVSAVLFQFGGQFKNDLRDLTAKHLVSLIEPLLPRLARLPTEDLVLGEEDLPILAAAGIASTSENRIKNASFEAAEDDTKTAQNHFGQPKYWGYTNMGHKDNIYVTNDSIRRGTLAVKLEDRALCAVKDAAVCPKMNLGFAQATSTTKNGTNYHLSIYIRTKDIIGSPKLRIGFIGTASPDDPNYGAANWSSYSADKFEDLPLPTSSNQYSDWQRYEFVYTNAALGKYPFFEIIDYQGGTIFFDDAQLTEGETAIVFHRENLVLADGSIQTDPTSHLYPITDAQGSLGMEKLAFANLYVYDADIKDDLTVTDELLIKGSATFSDISSNLVPSTDSTYDLGSASRYWASTYTDNLYTTGNVGLGTTSPGALLHVGSGGTLNNVGANDVYIQNDLEVDGTIYGNVSGTITPNFTQGSVVFADSSGNLAEDNANFFWDDTNNRLGIGTASPSSFTLQVAGHVGPNADDTYDLGSSTLRWRDLYLGPGSLNIGLDGDDSTISFNTTSDLLTFQNTVDSTTGFQFLDAGGGTPILNIDTTNERVGIGTTSPQAALHVSGGDIHIDNNQVLAFRNAADSGIAADLISTGSDDLRLRVAGGDRITITSGGLVGIGDNSPSSRLEVGDGTDSLQISSVGDLTFVDADGGASITGPAGGTLTVTAGASQDLALTGADDIIFDDAQVTNIQLSDVDTTLPNSNVGIVDAINDAYDAATGGGGGLWTDGTTIIYPTDATDDLAIGGTSLASSIFSIDESDGIFLFGGDQSANPTLRFEATDSDTADFGFNTNDAFFFTGGNVGIGDTTPDALLDFDFSSTSTTGATEYGGFFTFADTGVVTTGTDTGYGLNLDVDRTGATGGTINTYGINIDLDSDAAGAGTATNYGLFVNVAGGDNNYA